MAFPRATADEIGEPRHPVKHTVDLIHHILSVYDDGDSSGRSEGHVENRPVFSDVNSFPPEHGVDPPSQARLLCQLEEKPESLVGHTVLRVIEKEAHGLYRHALAAPGVIREKFSQMQLPGFLVVGCKGFPGTAFVERFDDCSHAHAPFISFWP